MTPYSFAGKPRSHEFQLLLDTFFSGWTGFGYDEDENPVTFNGVEEALADLQSVFDIWEQQIRDGERTPDESYSPEEFAICCVTTGDICRIAMSEHKVVLKRSDGVPINGAKDLATINLTGRFGLS
jgi:hypothetical protein